MFHSNDRFVWMRSFLIPRFVSLNIALELIVRVRPPFSTNDLCIYMSVCVCVCVRARAPVCTYTCKDIIMSTHTHTHTHIYIYIYIYTLERFV